MLLAQRQKEVTTVMNGKRGRFGVADVLMIICVIALIGCGLAYYFGDSLIGSSEIVDITYEVRVTKVRSELTSHVNYGDKVWDSVYGEYVGTVEKVRTEQYTEQLVDKNTGELKNAIVGGYYNMYITVNAKAEYKGGVYYISESELRVGESVFLRLSDFCAEGYCTQFTRGGES